MYYKNYVWKLSRNLLDGNTALEPVFLLPFVRDWKGGHDSGMIYL